MTDARTVAAERTPESSDRQSGPGFGRRERDLLLDEIKGGAARPSCPRCGGACAVIRTDPRSDLSYVRRRIVVRCSRCLRSCGAEVDSPLGRTILRP